MYGAGGQGAGAGLGRVWVRGKGQPGGNMGWEPPREEQALETREMLES